MKSENLIQERKAGTQENSEYERQRELSEQQKYINYVVTVKIRQQRNNLVVRIHKHIEH